MEVHLDPDLQAKLTRLAAQRGSDPEALAREAIERLVDFDDWFGAEVGKGLEAADRGDLVEHEDVRRLIDRRFPS